jgi:hypothetical protein
MKGLKMTDKTKKRVKADILQYESDTGNKFRTAHQQTSTGNFYDEIVTLADIERTKNAKKIMASLEI